jgi:hypothetical protein
MNTTSPSLQRVGGSFAPSLLSFSLESFYKFLQVPTSICSSGFYIFTGHIQGLGDNKYGISLIAKSEGKPCTIVVEFFI